MFTLRSSINPQSLIEGVMGVSSASLHTVLSWPADLLYLWPARPGSGIRFHFIFVHLHHNPLLIGCSGRISLVEAKVLAAKGQVCWFWPGYWSAIHYTLFLIVLQICQDYFLWCTLNMSLSKHLLSALWIYHISIYIYKIKVLSVHWSKSRHILVAHVSNKVMNENTPNESPVCLSVCMFALVPRKVAHDSHKNGWRDYYKISNLDQISSNLRL